MKKYDESAFIISANYRELSYILFAEQPKRYYSAMHKWSGEYIGRAFESIEEAQAAVRKYCEEHNA